MASGEERMTGATLPVFRTAFVSWRDGLAALRNMPAIAAIVFVAIAVDTTTDEVSRFETAPETTVLLQFARFAVSLFILSVALAPAAIAINRYVLLGETARSYALDISSRRLRRFCGYSALINVLILSPLMVAEVPWDVYVASAVIVLTLVAIAVVVATWILFPAIAVDAPGANLRNAVRDTRFFRALAISFVTFFPALVAGFLIEALWQETPIPSTSGWILFDLGIAAVNSVAFVAFAAMSSHLYRAWAVRLLQPSGGVN